MKKSLIILVAVVAVILLCIFWGIGKYNGFVTSREEVRAQWANVENVYQRRADLIPNLVATVKGYATHEEKTLTEVIEARSKATAISLDPTKLNEGNIAAFQKVQDGLSGALNRLMVSVEQYPNLKADQNFLQLQSQLEGTENRITVERRKFNETAQKYDASVQGFFSSIIARMGGFEYIPYFKAAEGASVAPKVQF
jgi:LemA protein